MVNENLTVIWEYSEKIRLLCCRSRTYELVITKGSQVMKQGSLSDNSKIQVDEMEH